MATAIGIALHNTRMNCGYYRFTHKVPVPSPLPSQLQSVVVAWQRPHKGSPRVCRRVCPGSAALLVAVPALQRPVVEPAARLLPGGLPHDVGHPPGPVPAGGAPPQCHPGRPVLRGRAPRWAHERDVCGRLVAAQRLPAAPGVALLPGARQRHVAGPLPPESRLPAGPRRAHAALQTTGRQDCETATRRGLLRTRSVLR